MVAAALLLVGRSSSDAAGLKFAKSATADLNGDGRPERVYLTVSVPKNAPAQRLLHIGDLSVEIHAQLPEGIAIVDIDSKDRFKEVDVRCGNPGDGGYSLVYGFDGRSISEMGEVGSHPDFRGNGIVYGGSWTGAFMIRHKFALDGKRRKLNEIRQPMYYVGRTFKAESSFPICYSMEDASVVADIEPKSQILIVAVAFQPIKKRTAMPNRYETIERGWYLIKSQSGLMGWARWDTVVQHVPIPMAG